MEWFMFLFINKVLAYQVILKAPKYVEVNQTVMLNCSSSFKPDGRSAEFLMNGGTYTNIRIHNNKCYNTVVGTVCSPSLCQCSQNEHSYIIYYQPKKLLVDENVTFACKMIFENDREFVSKQTTIQIIEAPKLEIKSNSFCNETQLVTLVCTVDGGLYDVEFIPWIHNLNGTIVRSLQGINEGKISLLVLRSCAYQDFGEYTCRVSYKLSDEKRWINASTKLFVDGPPYIVNRTTSKLESKWLFTIQFYSTSIVRYVEWLENTMQLNNSEEYAISTYEIPLQIEVYGQMMHVKGYKSQLIIKHTYYYSRSYAYTVCISNMYTTACENFYKQKETDNSMAVVWVMLGVVLAIILLGLVIVKVAVCKPHRDIVCINAPTSGSTATQTRNSYQQPNQLEIEVYPYDTPAASYEEPTPFLETRLYNESSSTYLEVLPESDNTSKHSEPYELVE